MNSTGTSPSPAKHALRMAVIGCGPVGNLHAQAIADSSRAALAAVCDPDRGRRDAAAGRWHARSYSSMPDLLEQEGLDAVTIATPDHGHVEPALAAIAAGCHVFCEKPLATTAADAERLVTAAARRSVELAVDYNRRFASGYCHARHSLEAGTLGELECCFARVCDPTPPERVAREPCVMLTTLLVHHLDLVRWYGGDVRRLRAWADDFGTDGVARQIGLWLQSNGGTISTLVGRYRDDQPKTAEWLSLVGTKGSIVIEDMERVVSSVGTNTAARAGGEKRLRTHSPIDKSIVAHVRHFIERLAAGRAPSVTGRDGLVGLQLAEAAVESIASGKTIEI